MHVKMYYIIYIISNYHTFYIHSTYRQPLDGQAKAEIDRVAMVTGIYMLHLNAIDSQQAFCVGI